MQTQIIIKERATSVLRVVMIAMLITSAAACTNDDGPVEPGSRGFIWPLALGNVWRHLETTYDSTGAAITTSIEMRITGDTTVSGERWWSSSDGSRLTNRQDGAWAGWRGDQWMVAKYPATVGDTFHIGKFAWTDEHGSITDTMMYFMTVTATDKLVVVPAGTFRCYEYTSGVQSLRTGRIIDSLRGGEVHAYAVDVGPVTSKYPGRITGSQSSPMLLELASFELK